MSCRPSVGASRTSRFTPRPSVGNRQIWSEHPGNGEAASAQVTGRMPAIAGGTEKVRLILSGFGVRVPDGAPNRRSAASAARAAREATLFAMLLNPLSGVTGRNFAALLTASLHFPRTPARQGRSGCGLSWVSSPLRNLVPARVSSTHRSSLRAVAPESRTHGCRTNAGDESLGLRRNARR
jgi:hypothetical protein